MNLSYISEKFNTQAKCVAHLEKVKWNGTPVCPHCKSDRVTPRALIKKSTRGRKRIKPVQARTVPLYHCNACNKDFSVLTKTIFEGSHMPLPKWFLLIALMVNAKKGVSALQISRDLDVTYKTAWFSAMRVRCAMLDQAEMLEGVIEMDGAYIGGKPRHRYSGDSEANLSTLVLEKSPRGKGTKKVPVFGMVEREGLKRVVVKIFNGNPNSGEMLKMLKEYAAKDNVTVMTDEGTEFAKIKKVAEHHRVNHSAKEYVRGSVHTNTIEGFWSMFKNGLRGNYHVLSKKYLPFYLSEFAYKYNLRNNEKGTSFMDTLEKALQDEKCAVKYKPKKSPDVLAFKQKKKKRKNGVETGCVSNVVSDGKTNCA